MTRVLTALTHIASQLAYRWLPMPEEALPDLPEPETLDLAGWRGLIAAPEVDAALPWLTKFLSLRDPLGEALASAAHTHLAAVRSAGAIYVLWCDAAYPPLLRTLRDPPHGLTLLGDVALLGRPALAVVGSRKASALAMHASFATGRALAAAGAVVVSGGAFGCDLAAHHGVLAAGLSPAPAACVFACGLATLYPRSNEMVFRRLRAQRALLVSERLWDAPCRPIDFPVRNRIIAGLAQTTVVMQAADRSGALVTARLALDQGRDVVVFRHPDGDVRAEGGAGLLRDGAHGFGSAGELLELLVFSRQLES